MTISRKHIGTIGLHLLGGGVFMLLPLLFSPHLSLEMPKHANVMLKREMLANILITGYFYINYYYLLPKFYRVKKYIPFLLITFFILILCIFIPYKTISRTTSFKHIERQIIEHRETADTAISQAAPLPTKQIQMWVIRQSMPRNMLFETRYSVFMFLIVAFFSLVIYLQNQWRNSEKAKSDAELGYLKAQINPHFLFNTLNSIYALALNQSGETPTAIVQLSSLMRYATSVADKETVALQQEIAYVSDYIALQKLRLSDITTLQYRLQGDVHGKRISPFLLIPFVENAFKYGVNPEIPSEIIVEIICNEDTIQLYVRNDKVYISAQDNVYSGVGIANTRHRLTMQYPAQHSLHIQETPTDFAVTLQIQRL